jgi:hypothetical protein
MSRANVDPCADGRGPRLSRHPTSWTVTPTLCRRTSWHNDTVTFRRPPRIVIGVTMGVAGASQVLVGFAGPPSLWQLGCLVATTLTAAIATWWTAPDHRRPNKKKSYSFLQVSQVSGLG